jgi:hypothetical protein
MGLANPRRLSPLARTVLQPYYTTFLYISMGWTGVLQRSVRRDRAARPIEVAATHLSAGTTMRCRAGSINLINTFTYSW